MTTEQQQRSEDQGAAATATDVNAKVASMREAILKAARPAASAAAARPAAAAAAPAKNMAGVFARKMMQSSWIAQTDGQLLTDSVEVLEGGCVYLPGFLCEPHDYGLLSALTRDLQAHAERSGAGMINWSQHLKYEDPDWSPTFRTILQRLEEYFDVEILATRLNFYVDGSMFKPFHVDGHKTANGKKEDFTMGASLGSTRELAFKHMASGQIFTFPQGNGDIFAFSSEVNSKFQHGVPKLKGNPERAGPRFSIIAWGRRRSLNERNSSETARLEQQPLRGPSEQEGGRYGGGGGGGGGYHAHKAKPQKAEAEEEAVALPEMGKDDARPAPIDMGAVVALVERLVVQEAAKKKKQTGPGVSSSSASKGSSSSASGAAPQGSAAAPAAAVGGEKAKAAAGGRRRGRVQHSWAS